VVLALAALLLAIFALAGGDDDDGGDSGGDEARDVTIVQVRRDIPAHTTLTEDDLQETTVASDTITEDNAKDISEAIGFAYSEDLTEGQRILRSRLEVSGVAEELEAGRRAISLPVTQNQLVAGLIRQDDRVDLTFQVNAELVRVIPSTPLELPEELTLDLSEVIVPPFGEQPNPAPYPYAGEPGSRFVMLDEDNGNPISKVVLQNVRVLRVIEAGGIEDTDESEGGFLVLEVSPAEAELLAMMTNLGSYNVMLRGPEDTELVGTPGVNLELLVTQYGMPVPKTIRLPGAGAQ
jgi:pilus assembly protein CpaB